MLLAGGKSCQADRWDRLASKVTAVRKKFRASLKRVDELNAALSRKVDHGVHQKQFGEPVIVKTPDKVP
jgi:hypothetical protein